MTFADTPMIVVTAPTGNIGSKVLARLMAGGERIRVIARDPAKLPAARLPHIEVIEGSHGDRELVMRAFEDADCVFWLVASNAAAPSAEASYVDFSRAACDAFRRQGVQHVVGVSSIGRGWPGDAGYITATLKLDDLIAGTGVAYRALAVGSLMENVLRQVTSLRERGEFYAASPASAKIPAVASDDVAAVASSLLLDRTWSGVESVPLMGPEDITVEDMVQTLSEVLGRPIRFRQISPDDLKAGMISRGASEGMAQALADMQIAQNAGLSTMNTRPAPNNSPTTFRDWCESVLKPAVAA